MNKVSLVGRLTKDPEVRIGQQENSTVARFSIAVNRKFKNSEGKYDTDFPNIIAFGKTAQFIEQYFKKGMMIGIIGRIQTGSYTNKEGNKVYTTDVVAEEVEFTESKGSGNSSNPTSTEKHDDSGFMNIPDGIEEALPFN